MNELLILFMLFSKHFVIDFPLQTPYQWMNKGTYGHPGGLLHAGLHAFGTLVIFLFMMASIEGAIILALIDGILHYHIDWAKMRINAHYGWKADKHPEFWVLLGLDQYLHALTYLLLVML
jgi:hypothetical protein